MNNFGLNEAVDLWRAAGGRFHGPNVETGTMPEAQLLPFLVALIGPYQRADKLWQRVNALKTTSSSSDQTSQADTAKALP